MTDSHNTLEHNQAHETDHRATLYACPMHREVQGGMDEKCPKCGMELTEPVPKKTDEKKTICINNLSYCAVC